jgi:Protein of unknown function (DUF3105)
MASRKEEKDRLRQERLEREADEAKSQGRKQRLRLVGGALLGLAVIAAIIAALVVGTSASDPSGGKASPPSTNGKVKLPEPAIGDYKDAAKAAGCKLSSPPIEGQDHADRAFKASDYKTNPPTSGNHNPVWYEDGVYNPGDTPKLGMLVHTLEHGRIDVQYRNGTAKQVTDQLEAFVAENQGYHMLMFENTTNMPAAVAATAWGHSLTCDTMNPKVFDALRTFRDQYLDKGPEKIP